FCGGRQVFSTPCQPGVVGENGAAAAGRHDFVAVEAQYPHQAESAAMAPAIEAAQRLGGIFDQVDSPFLADQANLSELTRMAKRMHGDTGRDPLTAWSMKALASLHFALALKKAAQSAGTHAERRAVNVDKGHLRAGMACGVGCSDEAQRL